MVAPGGQQQRPQPVVVPGDQKPRPGPAVKPLTGIKKILQTKATCDSDKQAFVDFVQFVDKKIGSLEETDHIGLMTQMQC